MFRETMSRLVPSDVEVVIHHGDCPDGVGAASIVWSTLDPAKVQFFPAYHGRESPREIEGKNVLILDFSYPETVLKTMLTQAKSILILDHHKTAMKALEFLPDHQKVFDMNKSGVSLTWEYFYPDKPMPLFYQYIEDGDLWRKKLPYATEYYSWIQTLKFDYSVYALYAKMITEEFERVMASASGMVALNKVYVERAVEHAWLTFTRLKDKYYNVAIVNSTILHSEIGNALVTKHPLVDFAAVYSITGSGSTKYSLRSSDTQADCSTVAVMFGGGGHRNASGMCVEAVTNRLPGPVYDVNPDVFKTIRVMPLQRNLGNVISLYSDSHRHMLGAYLLQTKYGEVTQAQAILKIVKDMEFNGIRNVAVVWSYDVVEDASTFVFSFHPSMKEEDMKPYIDEFKLTEKRTFVCRGKIKFTD